MSCAIHPDEGSNENSDHGYESDYTGKELSLIHDGVADYGRATATTTRRTRKGWLLGAQKVGPRPR